MKKLIALLLVLVMAISLVACNQKPVETNPPETKPAETKPAETTPPTEPAPMVIKWATGKVGDIITADQAVIDMIEQKYGVDIVIEEVNVADPDALRAYLQSGATPDALSMSYEYYQEAIEAGALRSIPAGYYETYMPDWANAIRTITKRNDMMIKIDTYYNGEQYVIPYGTLGGAYGAVIRQDWLDKLGLPMPTNLQELHDVLYAFTYNDPDGNGEDDTWGFCPGGGIWMGTSFLQAAFGYGAADSYVVAEDGTVRNMYADQTMYEFLTLFREWLNEGIIYRPTTADHRAAWAEGKVGVIEDDIDYLYQNGDGRIMDLKANFPDAKASVLAPLTAADGKQYYGMTGAYNKPLANLNSIAFGANCSDEVMQKVMEIKNDLVKDYEYYTKANTDASLGLGVAPLNPEWLGVHVYGSETAEIHKYFAQFEAAYLNRGFNPIDVVCEAQANYWNPVMNAGDGFWFDSVHNDRDFAAEWEGYVQAQNDVGFQAILAEYTEIIQTALGLK